MDNASGRSKILIVDDDPVSQRLFSAIFGNTEFDIIFCDTAAQAVERLAVSDFDILITEIVLPDDNGFELRKRVRLISRELSIIFVSAVLDSAGRKLLENLANDAFTFFMRKPILKAPMLTLARQLVADLREREMHRNYFEQLQSDLKLANKMQQLMLPDWINLESLGLFMSANYVPRSHLSGDYFDLLHLSDGRYFFVIGDISGHGVRSALQMSVIQSLTRSFVKNSHSKDLICDYLNELNRQICVEFDSVFYLTCLAAVIDPENRTLEYLSAGHPGFFIYHGDTGRLEYGHNPIDNSNIPVGWLSEQQYHTCDVVKCAFPEDGMVVALTDGVIERANDAGAMLGIDGLVARKLPEHLEALLPFVLMRDLEESRFTHCEDDMLILALGFRNPQRGQALAAFSHAIPQHMRLAAELSHTAGELAEKTYHDVRISYYVELIAGEFLNNIIVHALDNAQRLTPKILFKLDLFADRAELLFADGGKAWEYVPSHGGFGDESGDSLYDLAQAGRGMRIIEEIVDKIERTRIGNINVTKFVLPIMDNRGIVSDVCGEKVTEEAYADQCRHPVAE